MHCDDSHLFLFPEPPPLHRLNARERIPDDVDVWLAHLARQAQHGDVNARNRIYEVLQPRLTPIFLKIRSSSLWREREGRSWTFDDLEQEAFLIVCDLIAEWTGAERGIVGFIFSRLPWRLRDVLRRWSVVAKYERPTLPVGLPADDATDLAEVRVVLEGIFARLPAEAAEVLHLRAIEGLRNEGIAERLGVTVRTVIRRRHAAYRLAKAIYLEAG